jgi:CPA2 family monovalent cation:H+ antiporter-2
VLAEPLFRFPFLLEGTPSYCRHEGLPMPDVEQIEQIEQVAHVGNIDLILTLAAGLAAAVVLGYITQRLKMSPLVGYLLAGIAVGPHTPGFEANKDLADQMAELGVILLMFGVGLQFHFSELLKVQRIAIPGAIGQSVIVTALGCALALAWGWGWSAGLVFGLAISIASTVVLIRVLADNNALHTPSGHIAVGWLIVEDIFTVLVLVVLPVLATTDISDPAAIATVTAWSLLRIAVLIAFVFFIGSRVIPWLLSLVARSRSRELFTLTTLVIALGIAVGAAKVFGVSMALGAFLAGMVVGQSEFSSRAASEALPMRDAFAVLFFVSVGMLFDPAYLLQEPLLVLATLAIILVGQRLAAFGIVLALGYPLGVALSVAMVLGQIGEFSFILAALGHDLKILPDAANSAIIAAALVSISVNPLLYRLVGPTERWLTQSKWLSRWFGRATKELPAVNGQHPRQRGWAVIVGYGPVGRSLVRMLMENGIEPHVVELNLDTVHRLRDDGIHAVYGDAAHKATLLEAGVRQAIALVLTSSSPQGASESIRLARELNPAIRVLVRANYLKELPGLRRVGADVVFASEGEVALTMTEFLLRQLGATEEQIDRERDRIREELFGSPLAMELLLPVPPKHAPEADEETAGETADTSSDIEKPI